MEHAGDHLAGGIHVTGDFFLRLLDLGAAGAGFGAQSHEIYDEAELEEALTKNVTDLLLEMGAGFAFIGRQKEVLVGGRSRKIGLLICSNMDSTDVQWSFRGLGTPMGVTTYNNIRIKDALPSKELLEERMRLLQKEMHTTKRLIRKKGE